MIRNAAATVSVSVPLSRALVLALVLAFAPLGVPRAAAQGAAQGIVFSPEATEACLADGNTADFCIGSSAEACMATSETGYTTVGMGACFEREWLYWDGLLNAAYQSLRADLAAHDEAYGGTAPSQADALRDMQRAWIAYRDARCDYERSLWGGGTGGGPAAIACLMSETARQTLYLEEQATGAE